MKKTFKKEDTKMITRNELFEIFANLAVVIVIVSAVMVS